MIENTSRLALPLLAAGQAQKHVTHNEALTALDALVQLSVAGYRDEPPAAAEGLRVIVGSGAGGAFSGRDGALAYVLDGAWLFATPQPGWRAWIEEHRRLEIFDGTSWSPFSLRQTDRLGIAASPDETNRLAVSSEAVLFNHAGGDSRVKLNKAAPGGTASLLFQTNWSGRAEFGLAGDDDWRVKVSPDGGTWHEAVVASRTSGAVRFPAGVEHAASRAPLSGLIFTPGGDGQVSIYRSEAARSQNPRKATIRALAADIISLTAASADLFFHPAMAGVSQVRIWNLSRTPAASAWVRAAPATDQLQVTDSTDVAGWAGGDIIQIGDPLEVTPGRVIALDISPMLQSVLGAVFPQRGILCKAGLAATSAGADLALSPTGSTGSFVTGAKSADAATVWPGLALVPCTQGSPISRSNLVMLRETSTSQLGIGSMSSIAVLA